MENFTVTWEVKYYDHQPEIVYYTEELIESKNLESLKEYLDENAMDHSPEMDVQHEEGDFNIEWVLITVMLRLMAYAYVKLCLPTETILDR